MAEKLLRTDARLLAVYGLLFSIWGGDLSAATALAISQTPLSVVLPSHPQVLIAIGNSGSMDGNLSGAIMTGSGSLTGGVSSLSASSSPVNYTVPAGFVPPVQAANSSGQAPYTVTQSGRLVDNGPSRLNVAKAGIEGIINAYMANTDFALATYQTSNTSVYSTWVYYMSPDASNFSFTNFPDSSNTYVTNPCFSYQTQSSTVNSNCSQIAGLYGGSTLRNNLYMQVGNTSDDSTINDVLYTTGNQGVFVTYNGPNPATPYPPNFTLSNYNNGSVQLSYSSSRPNIGGFSTGPTNAGFVPFSQQVMYAQRGFAYLSAPSANSGRIVVPMTSAGNPATTASVTTAINQFVPYLNPETNSSSTQEIKAIASQSPLAGLLTTAKTYLTGLPASSSGCPPKKYVLLISDGLPTEDLSGRNWPPLGSAAAIGYGVTATFNADGSLNSTNNQALTDAINAITNLNTAGIKTYVIGLGAGVNTSVNPQAAATLQAMAIAGGTTGYYPATSSTDLVNDLNNILFSIQNGSLSITAATVNSARIQSGVVEYQASFTTADSPYLDWTGDLVAQPLDAATGVPTGTILWSAQTLLDALVSGTGWSTTRFIATWNPARKRGVGDGVAFLWTSLSTAQKALLQPSDNQGSNRVEYLRGNTALEVRNGGTFRNRSHILGDIVDSQATYVGIPSGPYSSVTYLSFQLSQINRQPMLYVGANDGLLHAFNASTGRELFAFVPNGVMKTLYNLTAPLYNQSHLFFVNGSPQSGDVQFSDSSWHTLLVGGENGGGNSIYAMDVTNPSSFTTQTRVANAVLWEFTDADMGLSYSEPQIAPIASSTSTPLTFAVFFGNGYNNPNNNAVLYALNPQTGSVIRKINLCTAVTGICSNSQPQGLSTISAGNSSGLQGQPITTLYAGDLQGNFWSVDVSSTSAAAWTPRVLLRARDSGGAAQPITTPPVITLHPLYPRTQGLFAMFGTGQLLTVSDLTNTQRQTVYGVWDKPATSATFTRSNLQSQTLTLIPAATSGLPQDILTATTNSVNWSSQMGWFDDLPTLGQRIVSSPQLLNGAFLATLITPPLNVCASLYSSMLLELNYLTGGAFFYPQLDINASGSITTSDNYNGAYPVGIGLPAGYASAPTILGPTQSNTMSKLITSSGGQQSSIINPNNSPRTMSWWEFQ